MDVLGVKPETLDRFGAVSRETALEMAVGVRMLFSRRIALDGLLSLSVTGIAGPGGGTPEKPVGLVWIALSSAKGDFIWQHQWQGSRKQNKLFSAQAALQHLIDFLQITN